MSVVLQDLTMMWLWLTLAGIMVTLYWTPTLVAVVRQQPNVGSVALLNGLAGWTLIGWVMAFTMAGAAKPQPFVPMVPAPSDW